MKHHRSECQYRKEACKNHGCSAKIIFKDIDNHDDMCPYKLLECRNKCG